LFLYIQEEYRLEGIEWKEVDYADNSGCLELYEKRPTGLFYLIDEKYVPIRFFSPWSRAANSYECFLPDSFSRYEIFLDKNIFAPSRTPISRSQSYALESYLISLSLDRGMPSFKHT